MIGSIHVQVNGSAGGDSSTIQHAVEQALLTNIHGLSEVSVQVEKEGLGGYQSCFCNGWMLKSTFGEAKPGESNFAASWLR